MSANKSLVFCAIKLEIIFISDCQAHELVYQRLSLNVLTHFLTRTVHIILNIELPTKIFFTFEQYNSITVSVYCITQN